MSIPPETESPSEDNQEEQKFSAHHPYAPSHELFDISTTVDPGYIISLIRKLLPRHGNISDNPESEANDATTRGTIIEGTEKGSVFLSNKNGEVQDNRTETMDTVESCGGSTVTNGKLDHEQEQLCGSVGDEFWEECGCVLWDLAANKAHAEFMVQNLILEVLLANLVVSQSVRATEISIGIIGNIACHEGLQKAIISTNGLIGVIMDQLFRDDAPCLCEGCRLVSLSLQSNEASTWAEALGSEQILGRILWIAENTLNPQLTEKSVGLLLTILESRQEVAALLLPTLVRLGLPDLLVSLLGNEVRKLTEERLPERYSVLDLTLRAIEALSVVEDYSEDICSNHELLQLLKDLIRFPDKIEVADSCVTVVVVLANILTDAAHLASELSRDLIFLQGVFEIFPFTSDDNEARNAWWSIVARLLIRVQECEMGPSSLHQFVSVVATVSNLIEEDLLDHQLDDSKDEDQSSAACDGKHKARTTALKRISDILTQWISVNDHPNKTVSSVEFSVDKEAILKLLVCCRKYIK